MDIWILSNFGKNKKKPKVHPASLVEAVCDEYNCRKGQLIIKGRKNNKAREVAIHIARDLSGMSCKDLGEYFGGVSGALITMMYNRVSKEAAKNRRFKGKIEKIKQRIFNI